MVSKVVSFVAAMLVATTAGAGTFSIAPVRVELSATKGTEVLTLRNQENTPVVIQASVHEWSQVDGEEVLGDTRDVLSTPPVFTLPANGEQVVRVALRAKLDGSRERSYRLILQEVLPEAPSGFTGLRVALKLSLPIFVAPTTPAKAVIEWQAKRLDADRIELHARNNGSVHLQVTDFTLSNGATQLKQSVSRYVLPGSHIVWTMPATGLDTTARAVKLHAFTDQGEVSAEITLDGS